MMLNRLVLFQICSTLVHIIGLITVDDVGPLSSLLTEKSDILSTHLKKYVSATAEQTGKGRRNAEFF